MSVYKRGGIWYVDYYLLNGERKRERIGSNKKLAISILQKRKTEVVEGKYLDIEGQEKKTCFKEIANDFLKYSKNNKRSFERDKVLIQHLLDFFSGKQLDRITPAFIEKYKSKRLNKEGMAPATVNREIACLKCMFNHAIRNKKTSENPMKYVKLFKENNTRIRYLSEEEMVKLLEACSKSIRPIVIAALATGMRKSEILNLKWEDINFKNGIILLRNTKGGKWREIPISSVLICILDECRHTSGGEYVFCKENGEPYKKIDSMFQNIVKRSGIKDFHFHDLRHTAASYLVMDGVGLITVKEILGHQKIETTLRYTHLSPAHKKEAVEILGKRLVTLWSQEKNKEVENSQNIVGRRGTQVAEGAGLLNL